jgi:hypothetical protein
LPQKAQKETELGILQEAIEETESYQKSSLARSGSRIAFGKIMFRKLLSLIAVGSATAAQPAMPDVKPNASKIFRYVIPAGYFDHQEMAKSLTWPIGHGLHVALVYDLGGSVRNVLPEDLPTLGITAEQAKQRAIANLEVLALTGAIGQQRFTGPSQKPFVLFGGHWAAATCILLPGLREMGAKNVGSAEVCVCIPHREALLMFPKGDKEYRAAMRKMIEEHESDGRKPLTFELFELTSSGIKELKD